MSPLWSLQWANHSYRGVLPSVCLFECDLETSWMRSPVPLGAIVPKQNKKICLIRTFSCAVNYIIQTLIRQMIHILDFKLLPCFERCMLSSELFISICTLTLCRSYLNLYCLGRKTAFFPVGIQINRTTTTF
jgi:hypothetical protein